MLKREIKPSGVVDKVRGAYRGMVRFVMPTPTG